jgi:hypothetical protein
VDGAATAGVTVLLNGSGTFTTSTDASGRYRFDRLADGTYTVRPSKTGYVFNPSSATVTVSGADAVAAPFTSAATLRGTWAWQNRLPQGNSLSTVWGAAANDVWAVGDGGTLLHWDGSAWSLATWPSTEVIPFNVMGVWGTAADDVWAVGGVGGVVLHWNGAAWSFVSTKTSWSLHALWGSAANDVWAVGYFGTIVHWDGSAWSSVPSGVTTNSALCAVWGTAANDVWASGEYGNLLHWDGKAWTATPTSSSQYWTITGIWGSSPSDVWAVTDHGTIERWDGTQWRLSTTVSQRLTALWGSGANDVWAVGYDAATTPTAPAIVHWDGTSWSSVASAGTPRLNGVWGSGASDAWAVGAFGRILRFDGSGWSELSSGPTQPVYALAGSGATDLWAVGGGGTALPSTATPGLPRRRAPRAISARRGAAHRTTSGRWATAGPRCTGTARSGPPR